MLRDVTFKAAMDPTLAQILSVIGNGGPRLWLGPGLYVCSHWSIHDEIAEPVNQDPSLSDKDFWAYGVCDSPEQLLQKFPELTTSTRQFFVSLVRMRKSEQPAYGGWRWHKWGPYIGVRKPQYEYLYDEPEIDEVYTYHVYEFQPSWAQLLCTECGARERQWHLRADGVPVGTCARCKESISGSSEDAALVAWVKAQP